MACPGGCVNGGGQPIRIGEEQIDVIKARQQGIYNIDKNNVEKTIDYSFFKDGNVGEFSNMNKYEQDGLIGTIKMVQDIEKLNDILNKITANPLDTEAKNDLNEWKKTDSIDKFYNHMSMMGRKETENTQEKNTYLGQDNSKIAEILYTKLIEKANFDNAIVKNINWNLNGKTFEDKALEIITEMNKYSI